MELNFAASNTYIVFDILRTLSQEGKLGYFNDLQVTPTLSAAVCGAISELKHAGITPDDLAPDKFVDLKKGEDFKLIYTRYEEVLKHTKRIDACDLVTLATTIAKSVNPLKGQIFIMPSNLKLSRIEIGFIETIVDKSEILHLPQPFGLEQPSSRVSMGVIDQGGFPENALSIDDYGSGLAWLYDVEGFPGTRQLTARLSAAMGKTMKSGK